MANAVSPLTPTLSRKRERGKWNRAASTPAQLCMVKMLNPLVNRFQSAYSRAILGNSQGTQGTGNEARDGRDMVAG